METLFYILRSIGVAILVAVAAIFLSERFNTKERNDNELAYSIEQILGESNVSWSKKPESTFINAAVEDTNYCQSKICIQAAKLIQSSMNHTVKPCDNFYDYVCGNYTKESTGIKLNEILGSHWLISLMLIHGVSAQSPQYQWKTRQYVDVCMNESASENSNNELKSIMTKLGGWPILLGNAPWSNTKFNWISTLSKLRKRGFSSEYFFKVAISQDPQEEVKRIIYIDAPTLSLDKFAHKEHVYFWYMVHLAKAFGVSYPNQESRDIMGLETKLVQFTKLNKDNGFERLSISKLQSKYPFIDWLAYINDILHPEATVLSSEIVHVADPYYLSELTKMMTNTSRTPSNRTLANYIFWRVFGECAIHLNKEIRDIWNNFDGNTPSLENSNKRVKDCVSQVAYDMDLAFSGMFVESIFDKRKLQPVTVMSENIRDSLRKVLEQVSWMDNLTKEKANEKINKMDLNIGYSQEIFNRFYINNFYQDFNVDEKSYFNTVLNFKRFNFREQVRSLREPIDKNDWHNSIYKFIDGSPYYAILNSVYVPATSIHDFLYNVKYPNFVNYARLGVTVGHEMIHAFDTNCRILDGDGHKTNWWSKWSSDQYLKKIQCIIEHYGVLTLRKPLVDDEEYDLYMIYNSLNISKKTLNENLCDIGGAKIAYHAYTSWLKENSEKEPLLYDFKDFTLKQMFWISFASMMCDEKYTLSIKKQNLKNYQYSANKFRVLGTLINLPEFSQDFHCQPNDLMNKMKKCNMW